MSGALHYWAARALPPGLPPADGAPAYETAVTVPTCWGEGDYCGDGRDREKLYRQPPQEFLAARIGRRRRGHGRGGEVASVGDGEGAGYGVLEGGDGHQGQQD